MTRPTRFRALGLIVRIGVLLVVAGTLVAAPIDDYAQRKAKMDTDLGAEQYLLAKWCAEQKMYDKAREHFQTVLATNPQHGPAIRELKKLAAASKSGGLIRCEILMRNGDLVKASLLVPRFVFHTSAGVLRMPVGSVEVIRFGHDRAKDYVVTHYYKGEGYLDNREFTAKSKLGQFRVKADVVSAIRIVKHCKDCQGRPQVQCGRCRGRGRLTEKNTCTDCAAKGWTKCTYPGCVNGNIPCPLCDGLGRHTGIFRQRFSIRCVGCDATGRISCPGNCDSKGRITCKTCKGNPITRKAGPCPVCKGKKTVPCPTCNGTGVKPLSPEARKAFGATEVKPDSKEPDEKEVATDPVIP